MRARVATTVAGLVIALAATLGVVSVLGACDRAKPTPAPAPSGSFTVVPTEPTMTPVESDPVASPTMPADPTATRRGNN